MTLLDQAKEIPGIAAFLGATLFFIYKVYTGYFRVNLSLSICCNRVARDTGNEDILVICLKLKKGDNGSLTLHDACARIRCDSSVEFASFFVSRSENIDASDLEGRRKIDWKNESKESPLLKLIPGEETELAT